MLIDRNVIRVSGEDVRGFLQGLVTADTVLLTPDTPTWAALLSPQGKVLFDFILWADGDDVLIDVEAAQAEALTKRLTLYRLRRAITLQPDAAKVHWSPTGDQGVPDPASRTSATAGSAPSATPRPAGTRIACHSASPKASANSAAARRSGSNATRAS